MGNEYSVTRTYSGAGKTQDEAIVNLEMLIRCLCNDEYRVQWYQYVDRKGKKMRHLAVLHDGQVVSEIQLRRNTLNGFICLSADITE